MRATVAAVENTAVVGRGERRLQGQEVDDGGDGWGRCDRDLEPAAVDMGRNNDGSVGSMGSMMVVTAAGACNIRGGGDDGDNDDL